MRDISSLKKLYSTAIVDVAEREGLQEKILDDLKLIKECFTISPHLLQWLSLPSIDRNKKTKILEKTFGDNVSHLCIKIIYLLVNKSRIYLLRELYDAVKKEIEKRDSIIKITLTSAIPLDEKLKDAYKEKIKKIFNREPQIEYVIDKSLIGGCRIKGDEKIIDCTI
ncbi:MAG: ATP synthase F1 subunit delta, partial [Chitinispirillaceae bacterium]|nr:ATP synthase F1 subunit delta [Chitinispirillaceae bacterium]